MALNIADAQVAMVMMMVRIFFVFSFMSFNVFSYIVFNAALKNFLHCYVLQHGEIQMLYILTRDRNLLLAWLLLLDARANIASAAPVISLLPIGIPLVIGHSVFHLASSPSFFMYDVPSCLEKVKNHLKRIKNHKNLHVTGRIVTCFTGILHIIAAG